MAGRQGRQVSQGKARQVLRQGRQGQGSVQARQGGKVEWQDWEAGVCKAEGVCARGKGRAGRAAGRQGR